MPSSLSTSPNPTSPIGTGFYKFSVTGGWGGQGLSVARSAESCCSADQGYSQDRGHADTGQPSCSCVRRFAGRMAKSTAAGVWWRTGASPAAGGATPRLVSGRDQLDPGTGMATLDRGDGSRDVAAADAVAVPGESLRWAVAEQFDRPAEAVAGAAATAAAMGCLLAGAGTVA